MHTVTIHRYVFDCHSRASGGAGVISTHQRDRVCVVTSPRVPVVIGRPLHISHQHTHTHTHSRPRAPQDRNVPQSRLWFHVNLPHAPRFDLPSDPLMRAKAGMEGDEMNQKSARKRYELVGKVDPP